MPSDDGEEQNTSPYMTPIQRKKLLQEHERGLGSKPGAFLKKIRNDKVEGLEKRFDDLFRDVRALSDAGFFSGERSADYWDRVETDKEHWEDWEWTPHLQQLLSNQNGILTESYDRRNNIRPEFGIELGRCVRLLCGGRVSEKLMLQIAFSFLEGLMFDTQQDRHTTDFYVLSRMMEYTKMLERMAAQWQAEEIFEVQSSADLHERWNLQERLVESHGLNITTAIQYHLVREVDFFPTDPTDPNAELPEGNLADVDQYLSKLKADTDIERADEVIDHVSRSIRQLNNIKSYVDLVDLFNQVYVETEENGGRFEKSTLSYSDHDKAVHHLKQFAGQKENSYMWAGSPIVEQVNEDWVLTDFGKLVGYVLFDLDDNYAGWIHRYALNEEMGLEANEYQLVEDTLTELEI